MITVKTHKQHQLFDPWDFLSPKRRKNLDEEWPGLFRREILYELPVKRLKPFFSSYTGRPSKELYTVMGALLLQQSMDLCDKEATDQLSYNIQWHYALDIDEETDSAKYMCPKTLWSMRQLLMETQTDQIIFNTVAEKLVRLFSINTDNQRIDSVHIRSNMRRLGRVGIFSRTIHKFLVNLRRHHKGLFDTIDQEVIERYEKKKSLAAFSLVKPSQADKTLKTLSRDLFNLVEQFKDQADVCSMNSYKLMTRVLGEHCRLDTADSGSPVTVKPAKEVPSDSLQNPSDPDATYDGHKGQGYQVQIMETYNDSDDEKQKQLTPNLITHVAVETACQSDTHALMPAVKDTLQRDLAPQKLLADSLYGSDDNVQKVAKDGVQLVAPAMKGNQKKQIDLRAFDFDDTGRVTRCPQGHQPEKVNYKKKRDRFTACFSLPTCLQCPLVDPCPAKVGKKYNYLRYGGKDHRLALRRKMEQTDEFLDTYRWRAGAEATMSEYNTLTGVKQLRVRGFKAVRYCATLKAVGVNLFRAAAAYKARIKANSANYRESDAISSIFVVFKEQAAGLMAKLADLLQPKWASAVFDLKMAA